MYSQPHRGLIFQNQPDFFIKAPLQGVKSIMASLGLLRHRETSISYYAGNRANDLTSSPSLLFYPQHPPPTPLSPRHLSHNFPVGPCPVSFHFVTWQLTLWFSFAFHRETMTKLFIVYSLSWCQPVLCLVLHSSWCLWHTLWLILQCDSAPKTLGIFFTLSLTLSTLVACSSTEWPRLKTGFTLALPSNALFFSYRIPKWLLVLEVRVGVKQKQLWKVKSESKIICQPVMEFMIFCCLLGLTVGNSTLWSLLLQCCGLYMSSKIHVLGH